MFLLWWEILHWVGKMKMRSGMSKGCAKNKTKFPKPKIPHKNKKTIADFQNKQERRNFVRICSHIFTVPLQVLLLDNAIMQSSSKWNKHLNISQENTLLRWLENYIGRKFFFKDECRMKTLAVNISVSCLYQFSFFKAAVRKTIGATWGWGGAGSNLNLCQWPVS